MQPSLRPQTTHAHTLLVLGVLLAAVAALLVSPPAHAKQPDPSHDYYLIPQDCAGPARTAPQVPKGCRLNRKDWVPGRATVVLWGDSHAWQNIPALKKAARAVGVNLTAFVMGKCPPSKIRIQDRYPGQCERSNALALEYVRKSSQRHPVQVILGSHWAGFAQKVKEWETSGPPDGYDDFDLRMLALFRDRTPKLFPALLNTRARLATIGQTATCEKSTLGAPLWCTLPRSEAILHETKTRRALAELSEDAPQIDLNQLMCGPTKCSGKVDDDYVFWDWGHLSKTVNYQMAQYFKPLLRELRD